MPANRDPRVAKLHDRVAITSCPVQKEQACGWGPRGFPHTAWPARFPRPANAGWHGVAERREAVRHLVSIFFTQPGVPRLYDGTPTGGEAHDEQTVPQISRDDDLCSCTRDSFPPKARWLVRWLGKRTSISSIARPKGHAQPQTIPIKRLKSDGSTLCAAGGGTGPGIGEGDSGGTSHLLFASTALNHIRQALFCLQ